MTFKEQAPDGSTLITGGAPYMPADSLLLPPNLRGGRKDTVMDLNTHPEANQPGFWCAAAGSTNVPPPGAGSWWYGWTVVHDAAAGAWITQYAQPFSGVPAHSAHGQTWFRRKVGSAWQAWRTLDIVPISNNANYSYRTTNAPNDGAERTVHPIHDYGAVPTNAIWATIHTSVSAHAVANAACIWTLHYRIADGPNNWKRWSLAVHNHANAAFDMGRSWSFNMDMRPFVARGHSFQIALNVSNDPGSGAWLDIGAMHTSITYMGHSEAAYMYG